MAASTDLVKRVKEVHRACGMVMPEGVTAIEDIRHESAKKNKRAISQL
jgi:hypothetical protein